MAVEQKSSLISWLRTSVRSFLDQASEEMVAPHVSWMESELTRLRRQFDFNRAATSRQLCKADREIVATILYRRALDRCWRDSQLTKEERDSLAWLAGNVGLAPQAVAELNQRAAVEVFRSTLAKSFADGELDAQERKRLEEVASAAGHTLPTLMNLFFSQEGGQLLRSMFTDIAADGNLSRDEWQRFCQTAESLGVPRTKMLHAIREPARQLVEHALADARSDNVVTESEERVLASLLANIIEDESFRTYVRGELAEAKEMQNLARGLLPRVAAPAAVALRAGEIVHWHGPVVFTRVRELASGARVDTAYGTLAITDSRAVLNSSERSAEINHRRVLAHHPFGNCMEIRCSGKGAGRYDFGGAGSRAVAIWQTAIGRANQTIVASDDKESRRRISREVRQRVWQKYGGRCAECRADTYLEFDHIIPVAKGGGNTDANVQLLCRKCNLSKSDNI